MTLKEGEERELKKDVRVEAAKQLALASFGVDSETGILPQVAFGGLLPPPLAVTYSTFDI